MSINKVVTPIDFFLSQVNPKFHAHQKITPKQNKKGIDFLMNQYISPNGKEMKNNPFGYREIEILKNFTGFTFKGFYDAGNYYHSYYLPLYDYNGDNNSFEYYYNGEVNIIG